MPLLFPNGVGVRPIVRIGLERQISVQGTLSIDTTPSEADVEIEVDELTVEITQPQIDVEAP